MDSNDRVCFFNKASERARGRGSEWVSEWYGTCHTVLITNFHIQTHAQRGRGRKRVRERCRDMLYKYDNIQLNRFGAQSHRFMFGLKWILKIILKSMPFSNLSAEANAHPALSHTHSHTRTHTSKWNEKSSSFDTPIHLSLTHSLPMTDSL